MDLAAFSDRDLWDTLDDIAFWVKDCEGRFLWCNLTLAAQADTARETLLGTKDSDWFFNELATIYMEDDANVQKTRTPIINKPELVISPDGEIQWHATSKFPHISASGTLLGTYGMTRPMEEAGELTAEYRDLSSIVRYARTNIATGVSVNTLAKQANMSLSTLERTVYRHLRLTPEKLLHRIRMNRARHLLNVSTLKIGEVAIKCGYQSFSAFSRAFKKNYGCAPGEMRGHFEN